ELAPSRLLALHELPLDKALGCNAGVIGAGLPKHVAPAHPLETREHVLKRVIERVPHMERTCYIRRRNYDRERLCFRIPFKHRTRAERLRFFPFSGDARLDIGVIISLF